MQTECKCHGLSGSCSLKTCWEKMPHFRDVGDRLKARFDGAIKVIISNKGDRLIKEGETIKPPTELDLVYTTDSPDFCKEDPYYGTHGTVGRRCNDTFMGVGGCQLLCCSRGARMRKVVTKENCECRFLWCCTVKCKECLREQEVYTCEWLARCLVPNTQQSSMSDKDWNAFQLCSTSGQDKNRSLWQVIPQRKVFNTCFQISILEESKQTAGGHGMTKLQTLEQCVWKRYEWYNDGVVMQCYSRLFSIF